MKGKYMHSNSTGTVLTVCFLLFFSPILKSQDTQGVLVLDLDSTQFYCDVIPVDELEKVMGVPLFQMAELINYQLADAFSSTRYENRYFYRPPSNWKDSARMDMGYLTMGGVDRPDYLGTVPLDPKQVRLLKLMDTTSTSYFLTLNLYEILAADGYEKPGDDLLHVIHYELFDKNFQLVSSGRYQGISPEISPYNIQWLYDDFALDMLFWTAAHEGEGEIEDNFANLSESYKLKKLGTANKEAVGIALGAGMPYGGIGLEYVRNESEKWDWNAGVGWDFSGLKLGAGVRFYPMGFDRTHKPFAAVHYSFTSGKKMSFGKEYDEFGTLINPDEVSTYRIFADHSVHLQAGVMFLVAGDVGIAPAIGYSFPFKRDLPELLSGPYEESRENFVKFVSPGGISFGVTFYGFF